MILLNFTHPLTPTHLEQLATLLGRPVERVIAVPTQFAADRPFAPQVRALADACGLTPTEWQTAPILVNPPALNYIAVALLAELHGRMGYFPPVLRLRPAAGSVPPQFVVAEVLPLQMLRDAARQTRNTPE